MPGFVNNDLQAAQVAINTTTSDSSERWLNPSQPAFLAYNSTLRSNVTGTGDFYTIIANTEVYDVGSNYNNATGVFTAPLTGSYDLCYSIYIIGLTSGHTLGIMRLVTSNGTYEGQAYSFGVVRSSANSMIQSALMQVDMDAADTASSTVYCQNGTKVVSVNNADRSTSFGGRLVQ